MYKVPVLDKDIELTEDKTLLIPWNQAPEGIRLGKPEDQPVEILFPKGTKFSLDKIGANRRSWRNREIVEMRIRRGNCSEKELVGTYRFSFEEFNQFGERL